MRREQDAIDTDPDEKDRAKRNEKTPTAAKLCDAIGESFAEGQFLRELFADVAG